MFNLSTTIGEPVTSTFNLGNVAARPSTQFGDFNLFNDTVYDGTDTVPFSFFDESIIPQRSTPGIAIGYTTSGLIIAAAVAFGVYSIARKI